MSMHAGIDFAALRAVAVSDPAAGFPGASAAASPSFDGRPLRHVRVAGVTYLPDLGLQVCAGGVVPLEAVQDAWCLEFEIGRAFQGRAAAYAAPFEVDVLDVDACVLGNFYSRNFYHWISEELVKVLALEQAGFDGAYLLGKLPTFARESLELMGIAPSRVLDAPPRPVRLRHGHYIEAITARQFDRHPALVLALRERLLAAALQGSPAQPARRLWLDRRLGVNNAGRELVNPDEVYPVLEKHGVEVVDMGGLPIRGQLALSASASLISGPHGAGFIHTLFQPLRSDVIECYSPLFINPGVFEVCRVLRHRYAMVAHENCYGGYAYGNQLYVNPSQLALALESFD